MVARLTYLICTVGVIAAANQYVCTHPMYQSKIRKIDDQIAALKKGNSAPILVIGNSYVENALRVDERLSKFTLSGLTLADMKSVVMALPKSLAVKTVLVGVGYNYATPVRSHGYAFRKHITPAGPATWWWSMPTARAYGMSSTMLKEDAKCIIARTPCRGASEAEDHNRRADASVEHLRHVERTTLDRAREYAPYTKRVAAGFSEELIALRTACEKKGWSLRAFTAPVYSQLRRVIPDAILAQFHYEIRALGIPYRDLNLTFGDWGAQYFSDASHVDAYGSASHLITEEMLEFATPQPPKRDRSLDATQTLRKGGRQP